MPCLIFIQETLLETALDYFNCYGHGDVRRPPRTQEPQENHCREYRNPHREEQGKVPEEPPSSHSAKAPGSCSDKPTGPAGSRLCQSKSCHGPRDLRHITPQA
ncbi:hypothetical protein ILYODFUR_029318 [Ilyodon furcidens]|uniref:Uncharacterized protein n=1 Tax=Ilyodon furcidens TaxID=33524 RepID=A0ABV0T1G6_9TELE